MDMSGNILHTWLDKNAKPEWAYVKTDKNGDLWVIIESKILMRLDWDSNIKWKKHLNVHHDIAVDEDNDIYTLTGKDELVFLSGFPLPIKNNYIVVLSPDGSTKKEISLFHLVKQSIPIIRILHIYWRMLDSQNLWDILKNKMKGQSVLTDPCFDILHNNTLTIMDRTIPGVGKKGNALICVRRINLVGIVDLEQEKLFWSWGPGTLDQPHHPTLLDNGNILIFDNGPKRDYSCLLELDPLRKEVIWQYKASPPASFFSSTLGAAQRLPNGNTLITESNSGRVFEITRDGEIVWEFYNPDRDENGKRATIYRFMQITDPENYPKLKGLR